MTVTIAGRVEAKATVPSGGASVSATVANGGGAVTCTVPAASYYLTQAGGVSSLLTTLQSYLNDNVQGYPQNAAAMQAAVGAGTWSAGWLFDIASGNDTGAFGGVTLTAVSSPTYGAAGPRGGIDKAIGFDSTADALNGGANFDVGANDLVLAYVAKYSSAPTVIGGVIGKIAAALASGWTTYSEATLYGLTFVDGGGLKSAVVAAPAGNCVGEWHVAIAVIDRSTGKARFGTRGLTSGTTTLSVETTLSGNVTTAANFTVGASAWALARPELMIAAAYVGTGSGIATGMSANLSTALTNFANAINATWSVSYSTSTGLVSIGWTGYTTPTWSLSWTSTTLRDVLGFDADISNETTTQTSANQSPMVWFPDSPLNCDDHPSMTPDETDARSSESPTGTLLTLSGNTKYAHSNVRWQRVPVSQIREASALNVNGSLEVFYRNCIVGTGSITWFTPGSDLQIYWSNAGTDALLGGDANSSTGVAGWRPSAIPKFSDLARPSQQGWVGQYDVRIPRLVSSG